MQYRPESLEQSGVPVDQRTVTVEAQALDPRQNHGEPASESGFGFGKQSHGGQPLSKTTFQVPCTSRRQMELNVPTRLP